MGDRAPRSLCLGGELLIPLRGAASRSPTVDQHQAPLGSNKLYLNSLLNGLAYYLRLPSPPPSTGGPPCTGPPLWTTIILPLTPTGIHRFIAQTSERALQRGDHARDYSVLGQTRFQHVQNRSVAEACIGPHPKFSDVGRGGEKTAGQQFLAARPGSRIAAPQFDIPEKRGVGFQTKQRIIGSLAAIARIVTNLSALLMTE